MLRKYLDHHIAEYSVRSIFFILDMTWGIFLVMLFILLPTIKTAIGFWAIGWFVSYVYFSTALASFESRQKKWLRENGKTIFSREYKIGYRIYLRRYSPPTFGFYLDVFMENPDGKVKFRSEAKESNLGFLMFINTRKLRSQMQQVEEQVSNRLKNYPKGFEVYVSPSNSNVYLVNVSWLQLSNLADNYQKFINTKL